MNFLKLLIELSLWSLLIIVSIESLKLDECPILSSDKCTKHCDASSVCPNGWQKSYLQQKFPVCYCQRAFTKEERNMISKDECNKFFHQCFHSTSMQHSCNRMRHVCKQDDIDKECMEAFIELHLIKGQDISAKVNRTCLEMKPDIINASQ